MTPRILTHPHDPARHVVVGSRRRPIVKAHHPSFARLKISLPSPPTSIDYTAPALPVLENVYLNDRLGICVIAGGYHLVGCWTGNAGDLYTASDEALIADYGAIGQYVPGQPSTDNGCDEDTAATYWTNHGFANGTKLAAAIALDATNKLETMQAIDLFEGGVMLGLELPTSYVSPFPSANGFVWDVDSPNPSNGHCVVVVGYTTQGLIIVSWGMIGILTWAAYAALCVDQAGGQAIIMLSPDQIAKAQAKSPNGFAWADLQAAIAALGGPSVVSPSSPPSSASSAAAREPAGILPEERQPTPFLGRPDPYRKPAPSKGKR
jgi:hypothetical protein